MSKINLEDLIQSSFSEFQAEPPKAVWSSLNFQLWKYQFLKLSWTKFNIYYLSALVVVTVSSFVLINGSFNTGNNKAHRLAQNTINQNSNSISETNRFTAHDVNENEKALNQSDIYNNSANQNFDDTFQSLSHPIIVNPMKVFAKNNPPTNSVVNTDNKKNTQATANEFYIKKNTTNNELDEFALKPVSNFTASLKSGCAPLEVDFANKSSFAVKYKWIISNEEYVEQPDLKYIFERSGTYIITLIAEASSGKQCYKSDTIKVFTRPVVAFEIENDKKHITNSQIVFRNKSTSSVNYFWDFGDSKTSTQKNPVHTYEAAGKYKIKLIAWSENKCADSMITQSIQISDPEYQIFFPNAFIPDQSGSNKGYYSLNDNRNDVFHPIAKGVKSYELKIFDRKGILLFQSNDINVGWDGYYKERLASEDVYIWKASGVFDDGTAFLKSGNLTLVYR